jgi:HEAT repeat protein
MSNNRIEELVATLADSDWEVRQRAAETLGFIGPQATDALPKLRDQLLEEEDSDVLSAIIRAITAIESDKDKLVRELLELLTHSNSEIRQIAADVLRELGSSAQSAADGLWARLFVDDDDEVANSAARALAAIATDKSALLSKCLDHLREANLKKLLSATRVLAAMELDESDRNKAADALWSAIALKDDYSFTTLAFKTIIRLRPDQSDLLTKLLNDSKVPDPIKSTLMLLPETRGNLNAIWKKNVSTVLPLILGELTRADSEKTPEIQFLTEIAAEIPEEFQQQVLVALRDCFSKEGLGFKALAIIGGPGTTESLLTDSGITPSMIGRALLTESEANLPARWNSKKETVLPPILAALENHGDPRLQMLAARWLSEKAAEIPPASQNVVIEQLTRMQSEGAPRHLESAINAVLIQLKQSGIDTKATPLLELIRSEGVKDDAKIEAIGQLIKNGARDPIRALINEWVQWIAWDQKGLIEFAAESMRPSPVAIQPLVDQLNQQWQPAGNAKHVILSELLPPEDRGLLREIYEGYKPLPSTEHDMQLKEWLNSVCQATEKIIELVRDGSASKWSNQRLAKAIMDVLVADELKARALKVQYKIAKQLADMSDPKFFDDEAAKENHRKIGEELKRHAVPILGRRLPKEENVEIRECMAQALGYIGGREAIEALSRAVAGEERIRTARQELLAKYYLEPSKARSEEAANILKAAADEAKRTLRLQHRLNVAIFFVGLLLLTTGLLVSMFTQSAGTRAVSVLASFGGFAGLLYQMVNKPLERIQHAMANLVQIETAFTSFIWELNLNGTYIQSQYVAEGVLTDNEIAQTVRRIEEAMNLAMNLVAVYTQNRGQRIVTRINNLVPAAGAVGAEVAISGQHLLGDSGDKKNGAGIIAVDHTPINSADVSWNDREVKFKLPQALQTTNDHDQTVWISLFVDGMETNALPFHVVRQ